MQYAIIEIQQRPLLIDAAEMAAIDTYIDGIREEGRPDESRNPYYVCYGSYLPQHGTSEAKAKADFKAAFDHWIGSVKANVCHLIALHDGEMLQIEHFGRAIRIPFAALIQAHEVVIARVGDRNAKHAVTGFLRYADMSPATNIFNRPGVIALKGIERRTKSLPVDPVTWRKHIDRTRALRIARSIK